MSKVTDLFGSMVFNDAVMQERLPKDTYKILQNTIQNGKSLESDVANIVAAAMKDWAIEKGATHFTHWFQPLTGITAEKHDSFIAPVDGGKVIMEFSGKELIRGEPDASSFPSGGLRSTFEARGYTAWDPTSYAFIKNGSLCIPTAFCSYGGEALDRKTPLLRSMQAINKQALRVVKLFGNNDVKSIHTTVGAEQEYFLIDKSVYEKRPDLIFTGRTLFGAKAPKGQELDDHYFGAIKPRVAAFMKELNEELWKLGILAKTQHNEVAPGQHELAPIFTTTNIATDHNQLTMELMQRIAKKHDMVCLLHEKPFAGVNGSGKHNNWSLSTNSGTNLLEPGDTPHENAQFLLFLCAVIKAVDEYPDLIRISVASAGNDHRLGANEAPPAIVSIFLGEDLTAILDSIADDTLYGSREHELMKIGVDVLPKFPKDTTDRNRTSPVAFTGNKFEFRMPGSTATISNINVVINTIVAEELRQFADELETAKDFEMALHNLIKRTITDHRRIIFNGNGYDKSWVAEAEKRGLLNLPSTPDCVKYMLEEKNIKTYETHGILTRTELHSRYEVTLESYCKLLSIEACTMIEMVRRDILPAVSSYSHTLVSCIKDKKAVSSTIDCSYEEQLASDISALIGTTYKRVNTLEKHVIESKSFTDLQELATYSRDIILTDMAELRVGVDELESITASEIWPYPSYGDILFSVK